MRVVTWNQQARPSPPADELRAFLLPNTKFHIIAIGTEECENSIASSIVNTSKKNWEAAVRAALGKDYVKVRGRSGRPSEARERGWFGGATELSEGVTERSEGAGVVRGISLDKNFSRFRPRSSGRIPSPSPPRPSFALPSLLTSPRSLQVCGHTLQATNNMIMCHRAIVGLITEVESKAVATGLANPVASSQHLGNKGGVGIKVRIGDTSFCFINAHLAAHQNEVDKRNEEVRNDTAVGLNSANPRCPNTTSF